MNYYLYDPDPNKYNGYAVHPNDEDQVLSIHFDDGQLPNNSVRLHGFDDNPGNEGDFPSLSTFRRIPIVSQHAWDVLRPLVGGDAEPLLIEHPNGERYYFLHVKIVADCIDLDRSEVDRYTDGSVMKIVRYCVRPTDIQGAHIFKTPKKCGAELLVDDIFRRAVETNDLKGLRFLPIVTV